MEILEKLTVETARKSFIPDVSIFIFDILIFYLLALLIRQSVTSYNKLQLPFLL